MNVTLVTGSGSGLGRYIKEELNADGFTRSDSIKDIKKNYDTIIHSAFNLNKNITNHNYDAYLNDNIFLLLDLLKIPYKKFIFISTVDIYPASDQLYTEDTEFKVEEISTLYGRTKFLCEQIVKKYSSNYLILRPSALLGPGMRKNSLIKMFTENPCTLTLRADSMFNYISYKDILDFIKIAICNNLQGCFNASSNSSVTLKDIVTLFDFNSVKFGNYYYRTPFLSNETIKKHCKVFEHTSLEVVKDYFAEFKPTLK
jgi:nucleoside-diphosphate-sugar epimerase